MRKTKEQVLPLNTVKNLPSRSSCISASPEIDCYLQNISNLHIAPNTSGRLQNTLAHLTKKVSSTLEEISGTGAQYFFAGPDWCRQHPDIAANDHARVIIDTYGTTYALPNKYPSANLESLKNGMDMYLTYKNGSPVGTACLVPEGEGIAELGRAASQGKVGNRVIQDMRIIDWLVNPNTSKRYHTIFATCRTAPNRDVGSAELMRGGQAVSHMWGEMPELLVCGFGPLYKKHGALETMAYSVLTRENITIPSRLWVQNGLDAAFVRDWCENYNLPTPSFISHDLSTSTALHFHPEYPPLESGVTEYVHGEVKVERAKTSGSLRSALDKLVEVGVPFIQVPVPVDYNTLDLQRTLKEQGFQTFIFTPGYGDRQPPKLWFGKPNNVPVVPRYWDVESGKANPFWSEKLESHGRRIACSW